MTFGPNDGPIPGLPKDELDALLREWHAESGEQARASRDAVMARIGRAPEAAPAVWRFTLLPSLRAAAVVAVAAIAEVALLLLPARPAAADRFVHVPEGGRLDAVAPDGTLVGPCPLEHTDVDASISGFISRVTVTQRYRNTYAQKVEAVYTFPLSHRAAVDRLRMTVRHGDAERIVEGEVKERGLARLIYESARRDGFVASLLEQQRPNIFTQSVANIEPGAEVLIEISYVETLAMRDGRFTFDFPMVVGPRYIPGRVPAESHSESGLPRGLTARSGVVLIAPAQVRLAEAGTLTASQILAALERAIPVREPDGTWRERSGTDFERLVAAFSVRYADGSEEPGTLRGDGTGEVAGRWFWCPPAPPEEGRGEPGTGYAKGTDQVPDAALITPMPVRPPERAGHDLSLRISIESGGPAVTNLHSDLHRVDVSQSSPDRAIITLASGRTIPNRDFVLSWSLADGAMSEGLLTQVVPGQDGYFLLYLVPPARVASDAVRPRELVFVLDVSGSMNGFPIEKSKEVMMRMLGEMRPADTFNVITFANGTNVLWTEPRPATPENVKLARDFIESRKSGGGTAMMKGIDAALRQPPRHDGAAPMRIALFLTDGYVGNDMAIIDAVRRTAGTTRVFSFGIGDSVNRYLLAEMAKAGRGAADFVLLPSDADEVVTRFSERVQTPVLTDISVSFEGVEPEYVSPPLDALPDLFDREPLVIVGRYPQPGHGAVQVRGMTAAGPWERRIDADFPAKEGDSTVVAPIWARAQVDDILRPHLNQLQHDRVPEEVRRLVVRLAEQHRIMSPFTSFVAVEKTRVTLGGAPVLVPVPIELPQGVSWEGNFGSAGDALRHWRRMREERGVAVQGGVYLGQRVTPSAPAGAENAVRYGDGAQEVLRRPLAGQPVAARAYVPIEAPPPPPPATSAAMPAPKRPAPVGGAVAAGEVNGDSLGLVVRDAPREAVPRVAIDTVAARDKADGVPNAPPPRTSYPIRTIDIRPILRVASSDGRDARDIGRLVTTFIAPESWSATDGDVALRVDGDALVVKADAAQAEACRQFVETLRIVLESKEPSPPRLVESGDEPVIIHDARPAMARIGGIASEAGRSILERIVSSIDPAGWRRNGGSAVIEWVAPHAFVVRAPAGTHQQVEAFLKDPVPGADGARESAHDEGAAKQATAEPSVKPFSAEDLNRLSTRLDEALFLAGLEALAATESPAPDGAAVPTPGPVRVIARFAKVDEALRRTLASLGIEIEALARPETVMVLRVPRERIIDLGRLPETVRVETFEAPEVDAPPPARK